MDVFRPSHNAGARRVGQTAGLAAVAWRVAADVRLNPFTIPTTTIDCMHVQATFKAPKFVGGRGRKVNFYFI